MEGDESGIQGPLVFDTSALFNFGHRGELDKLLDLIASTTELLVPKAVLIEATEQIKNREYYQDFVRRRFQVKIGQILSQHEAEVEQLYHELGSGELEVIILALELGGTAIIDDPEAREVAQRFKLKIMGTLGMLRIAVQQKWMTEKEALSTIEKIRSRGFRIPAVQSGQSLADYEKLINKQNA